MNLLDRIKTFFSKNKSKQLPEPTKHKIETNRDTSYLQSLKIKDDPFSKLLSDENMGRINIEKELYPLFKEEISKIRDYFIKKDFMSVKNYDEFFAKYLLDGKLEIRLASEDEMPANSAAIYIKDKNQFLIHEVFGNFHDVCHELIHFLIMADSNKLNWSPSRITFINEGYTELLASEIDNICPQAYIKNVDMVRFLNSFSKTPNESIKACLKDEFAFGDEYMWPNISRYSENKNINSYRNIQREIIKTLIDKKNIKSIEDYIQVVNLLKQRPSFDKTYMAEYFNDLNRNFLENMKLPINEKTIKLLNQYCDVSYKAEILGNKEVIEFDFDDINGFFDVDGKVYGDFPDGGVTSSPTRYIELRHKDKKRHYSLEGFEGINWINEFNKVKESLYTFLGYEEKNFSR